MGVGDQIWVRYKQGKYLFTVVPWLYSLGDLYFNRDYPDHLLLLKYHVIFITP